MVEMTSWSAIARKTTELLLEGRSTQFRSLRMSPVFRYKPRALISPSFTYLSSKEEVIKQVFLPAWQGWMGMSQEDGA